MWRYVRAANHRVVRLLVRVAPKIASFGAWVLAYELERRRRDEDDRMREFVVSITPGDVRFTLLAPPRFASTQSDMGYGQWKWYRSHFAESGKAYEPIMLACLTRVLQLAATPRFMDVGAFLGHYACYVSALLESCHEVLAIESNPVFAEAIRESARVNGFSQLRVFQAALSDRIEPVSVQGVTVSQDANSRCTTTTLDELCEREHLRPTVVKMDVHGAEGKIVLGMRKTLAEVEYLLLEMHNLPYMRDYSPGVTRTAMLDVLEDAGLTLYYVAEHRGAGERGKEPDLQELLAGRAYSYRKLDRQARDLLLFDRREDAFVLAFRHGDIETLLGPNVSPANE
jgi:FkbM family methyltransferase